jgi:mono/diheme cytochrome c family protein
LLPVILAAALSAADHRPVPWEKDNLRIGQALYRENCVVCHDIDREQSRKIGPSFFKLFRRDQMPLAKIKPSQEYVRARVKFGGPIMPAFKSFLTEREINRIIAYIASQ